MTSTALGVTTGVNTPQRIVDLVAVPYDQITHLVANPNGELVRFGAFRKACQQPSKVLVFRSHDHTRPLGRVLTMWEEPDGLHATVRIRESPAGDELLADVKDGYVSGASIGFRAAQTARGSKGETVVLEADLREISLVSIAAYDGARVLAVRNAVGRPGHWASRAEPVSPVQPIVWARQAPATPAPGYLTEVAWYYPRPR